jgi:4-amino-4-deoxy-L-arabinose transferase-like glycosyltransferase
MPPRHAEPLATRTTTLSRRELVLVGIVLLVGVGLRLVAFSRSAVEHFDEGVYASNIYFGPPEYAYPQQRFFAPPLLPALIEAGMIAGLRPNVAAMLPAFIAGCATLVALWWFGRSWFGPRVGLAAAAFASASYYHVVYSTAALTDALLGLWLVLAIDAATRSLAALDFRWAIASGAYTGLAWWTKYNGWLPLAIEAAAVPLVLLSPGPTGASRKTRILKSLGCFGLSSISAVAVWAPYWWSLQSQGGYRPIAENHGRYLVGLHGWLDSASRQIANFSVIDDRWTVTMLAIVLGAPTVWIACTSPRSASRSRAMIWPIAAALLILLTTVRTRELTSLAILSLAGISAMSLGIVRDGAAGETAYRIRVGAALTAAWWVGTFLATPLYWPYSRLLMPWFLAACIGIAILLERLVWRPMLREPTKTGAPDKSTGVWLLAAFAAIGLLLNFLPVKHWRASAAIERTALSADRLGFVRIAASTRTDLDSAGGYPNSASVEITRLVYVMGEPALLFQLQTAGEPIVAPTQHLPARQDARQVPIFLVTGPHAQRDSTFAAEMAKANDQWKLVHSYDFSPSPIVWLDLHDPRVTDQAVAGEHSIQLYQFQP